jgi:osmotically-inducible protein OsmY
MGFPASGEDTSLTEKVESRVRQSTHGRIRNLVVKESSGQVIVSGQVSTRYTKQLALQGALELLSGDRFCEQITVI